ncbi:MAG: periplasmic binding protein-related protein [Proteobacteria bacterium]|nr:periplasmic binding protein-related protein [Pseudomonadota bacterium]
MNSLRALKSVLILCALLLGNPANAEESYTFAVVPQYEQRKLFTIWQPLIDELSRRTGYKLKLVATLTVPEFENELAKGRFDFAYINPYLVVKKDQRQGYIPLVRDQQALRGILVVRKDSPIKIPAELDGAKLAVPSLDALGACLLLRAELDQTFKARLTPVDVKSHSSVYLQVATGQIPAGGGVEKTFQTQDKSVQEALRVLYTTRDMPSHPVVAHPQLPAKVRQKLQQTLLELAATEEGRKLLQSTPIPEPVATSMQDYMPLKKLGLEAYLPD